MQSSVAVASESKNEATQQEESGVKLLFGRHPVVTVNGVNIVNFSSPHPFTFTNGAVLPACTAEVCNSLPLDTEEIKSSHPKLPHITDIELSFVLTPAVISALSEVEASDECDVLIVPLPVKTALEKRGLNIGKCRTCRIADRVTKAIHPDVFCK